MAQTTYAAYVRIGSTALAFVALAVLLRLHFRADLAPDYLRQVAGTYFNRGGFCFALDLTVVNGICYVEAYFQNQQGQPCLGPIAVRPTRGFFLGRAKIDIITFEIECEPAAFGVARVPVPVTRDVQATQQSFEVGASVDYPQGKGRRLRFHDGIFLRTNSKFSEGFRTAAAVAGVLGGQILLMKPATITFDLPVEAAEEIPADAEPEILTLWELGDPLLDEQDLTGI